MLIKNNSKRGKQTSTEVAASTLPHSKEQGHAEVLEALGKLSSQYSLPPPEMQTNIKSSQKGPKNPIIAAASESALGANWGMADYGHVSLENTSSHTAAILDPRIPVKEGTALEAGADVLLSQNKIERQDGHLLSSTSCLEGSTDQKETVCATKAALQQSGL
ncbi:hypothetical protein C8Q73DRAFT_665599 [Cubamyces lactineus]|nr:hypothetical protein C8Q73DRAFT_665599 [Cubamyces lactineus]